jgi:hypothetical protein
MIYPGVGNVTSQHNGVICYCYSPLLNAISVSGDKAIHVSSDNAPVVHRAVTFRSGNFFSSVETLPRYLLTQKRNVGLLQKVITPPFSKFIQERFQLIPQTCAVAILAPPRMTGHASQCSLYMRGKRDAHLTPQERGGGGQSLPTRSEGMGEGGVFHQ